MTIKGKGLAHATLTVSSIQNTREFYETLFETNLEMDDEKSFSLLQVGIPCWFVEWGKHPNDDVFTEKRIGLDHIAFEVESLEELAEIATRLTAMSVQHAGVERFAGKYPYIAFRDPDNIQTEFFIPEEI